MEMGKVTFLSITESELILTIEVTNVSSEIRLGGFAEVHFPSAYGVLCIMFSLRLPLKSFHLKSVEYQLLTGRNTVFKL